MTTPLPGTPRAEVIAEVVEAAALLEADGTAPAGFLAQVRAGAARLAAVEVAPGDIRASLALLEGHMTIDVDAPATSNRRSVVLAKRGFRRVARWYLRHLAQQVSALGEAVLRVETAVAGRLEAVEQRVDELDGLADLRGRVERLEAAIGRTGRGPAPAVRAGDASDGADGPDPSGP